MGIPPRYMARVVEGSLTAKLPDNLEDLIASRVLSVVGGMYSEVTLANGEEVLAAHVEDLLAAREREGVAVDLEYGLAVAHLDGKAVSRK